MFKKSITKKILFSFIFLFFSGVVFSATYSIISKQTSTIKGSNNSEITFSYSDTKITQYVNDYENSSVIGNYFKGYYYDSVFGFFKLDWSNNKNENVRIIGSTDRCGTGYGYKLGGKAYSENAGYIDFNFSNDIFVYYCEYDGKLHGKSYSSLIGYQNFEGIGFKIINDVEENTSTSSNTGVFINDDTEINKIEEENTSNIYNFEQLEIEDTDESFFYIIK